MYFHYRGYVLAFEIKSGTLLCLLLLPSIYTDLFPSLTRNTFSVWLSTVRMWEQFNVLKYNVGFCYLGFFWRYWHRWWGMRYFNGWKWESVVLWGGDILSINPKALDHSLGVLNTLSWRGTWIKAKARYSIEKPIFHHIMILLSRGVLVPAARQPLHVMKQI